MNPLLRFATNERPLCIETSLGADALAIVELAGREAVFELYDFRLRLAADRFSRLEFDKLLGKPATVTIATKDLGSREIHGILCRLERQEDDEDVSYYEARLVPAWWLATLGKRSRIYQQKTVPDILKEMLEGVETRFELTGHYPSRDFCVQYGESDYAFATRLMQEEGIFFFFEHRHDGHTLVIADDAASLPQATLAETFLFEANDGGVRRLPRVWRLSKWQKLCATRFTRRDQCFELFEQTLEAEAAVAAEVKIGTAMHKLVCREDDVEVYEYPGGYAKWFDGVQPGGGDRTADLQNIYQHKDRTVRLAAEAEAAHAAGVEGTSNCLRLLPGKKFALAQHGWGDGSYLALSLEHRASLRVPARSSSEGVSFTYENRLAAIADGVPYRPRALVKKPLILGLQTAIVTGGPGQEVLVDKYGRVKVQFPWDRGGEKNADSSCWVRVAQFWAGKRFGAFFWPRVGHEVVVAFEDGDPDRPLIVGSVYNSANMPPLELPSDVKQTGVKSCIYGKDPLKDFNAIVFHDTPGDEYVQVHSESHAMQNSKNDHYEFAPTAKYSFHGSMF